MGFFDRLRGPRNRATGNELGAAFGSTLSGYGAITPTTALQTGAVFRCVDLVSKTMAAMPLHMFIETENGKEKAKDHRLYEMLLRLPNEHTTAYEFWQMFVANLLLTRGGYAKIGRDGNGRVTGLWNIPTKNVTQHGTKDSGTRYITVTTDDGMETLMDGEFLFVPNFRYNDDVNPEDPLRIAANVLGLTQDLNTFAGATFATGVNPGGFLEVPTGLSKTAYDRLTEDFQKKYAGVQNQGKFILLEEGAKAQLFSRDLEKTQALESRKFAISEVCRLFGVPPHLCMDMEHATFSNIEQQSLEYVRDAINPMSVRIEQALYRDLLTKREKAQGYYFKFSTQSLLRGDTAARTAFYNAMRQNGVMSADEIRGLEDMNELPDGMGATVYINGNMLPLENAKLNAPKSAQQNRG